MATMSRRKLLASGSLAVVATGVATALPAPAAAAARSEPPADAHLDGPLIAHVTDVKRGRISVYVDDREIQITDRDLAARLFTATR